MGPSEQTTRNAAGEPARAERTDTGPLNSPCEPPETQLSGCFSRGVDGAPICRSSLRNFEEYAGAILPTIRLEASPYRQASQEQLERDYLRYLEKKIAPYLGSEIPARHDGMVTRTLAQASSYFHERYGRLLGEPAPAIFGPLLQQRPGADEVSSSDTLAAATPQCRTFRLGTFRLAQLSSLDGQMLVVHELAHLLSPVAMQQDYNRPEHFEKTRMGWCVGEPNYMANLGACRYYRAVDEATAEIDALEFARSKGRAPRPEYFHMQITLDRASESDRALAGAIRELTSGPDSIVADIRMSSRDRLVGALGKAIQIGAGVLGFVPGRSELIELPSLGLNVPGCRGSSRAVLVHALDGMIAEQCGPEQLAEARERICQTRFLPNHADAEAALRQSVGEEAAKFLKYAGHHALVFLYAEASKLPSGKREQARAKLMQYVVAHDGRGGDIN